VRRDRESSPKEERADRWTNGPEEALRQLEPLVGAWTLEATWPDGKSWPGGGTVTFEWHTSGRHLLVTVPEIAARLFVSHNTVRSEVGSIYRKLGVSSRSDAVRHATAAGLFGA
jgi:Bacterial regulatory proteins, luxR family